MLTALIINVKATRHTQYIMAYLIQPVSGSIEIYVLLGTQLVSRHHTSFFDRSNDINRAPKVGILYKIQKLNYSALEVSIEVRVNKTSLLQLFLP